MISTNRDEMRFGSCVRDLLICRPQSVFPQDDIRDAVGEGANLSTKCTVYGERPITEFCVSRMDAKAVGTMIRRVELDSGGHMRVGLGEDPLEVYVEAPLGREYGVVDVLVVYASRCVLLEIKPAAFENVASRLGKQIPRYVQALTESRNGFRSPLVRQIVALLSGKQKFLVSMTDDTAFPTGLRDLYARLQVPTDVRLGWLPYSFLQGLLETDGLRITGDPPNIWLTFTLAG